MRRILVTIFFLYICIFSVSTQDTYAQFSGMGASSDASTIIPSPRYPEPGENVVFTINDYSINTNGAVVQWFIDGNEVAEARNERKLSTSAGALGTQKVVLAVTTLPNGSKLEAKHVIKPIRIDMLIEADTLTPAFYKGRSIPSSGSPIRVTAIPFTGDAKSPESYSYTWRVGDEVQGGGSRFGKNVITFTSGFEKSIQVSVDVLNSTGVLISNKSIYVPLSDPELYFYEINPLRGMSETAIQKGFTFVGDEIRVRAEPYFISDNLLTQNPHREWKLNNQTIQNPSSDPQEITLRKEGDSGSFTLEFHIRNLQQLLQGIKDSIVISF